MVGKTNNINWHIHKILLYVLKKQGHSMRHRIVMGKHSCKRLLLNHQRCASV